MIFSMINLHSIGWVIVFWLSVLSFLDLLLKLVRGFTQWMRKWEIATKFEQSTMNKMEEDTLEETNRQINSLNYDINLNKSYDDYTKQIFNLNTPRISNLSSPCEVGLKMKINTSTPASNLGKRTFLGTPNSKRNSLNKIYSVKKRTQFSNTLPYIDEDSKDSTWENDCENWTFSIFDKDDPRIGSPANMNESSQNLVQNADQLLNLIKDVSSVDNEEFDISLDFSMNGSFVSGLNKERKNKSNIVNNCDLVDLKCDLTSSKKFGILQNTIDDSQFDLNNDSIYDEKDKVMDVLKNEKNYWRLHNLTNLSYHESPLKPDRTSLEWNSEQNNSTHFESSIHQSILTESIGNLLEWDDEYCHS